MTHRNFWSSSLTLALASLAFMIPGLVRTKTAATLLSLESLAMVGQLGQMQTLLISTGAAGVVTAARVVFARRDLDKPTEASVKNWFLIVPMSVAVLLALIVSSASAPASVALLGNADRANVIVAASLGVPIAVYGQVSLAVAQVRTTMRKLLMAAVIAATVGGVAAGSLVATGNDVLIAVSFVVTPFAQVCAIFFCCRESRPVWGAPIKLGPTARQEVIALAGGSAVLGVWASLVETFSRSVVVQNHGLSALATYQPVVLLVTQLSSIALGAVATAALVEVGQIKDRKALAVKLDHLARGLLPIMFALLSMGITFSPILIRVFFSEALVMTSLLLVMLAFSAEIIRAYAWTIGACLLPQGLRRVWLLNGLLTVGVQGGVGAYLGANWGAPGLVAGIIAGSLFSAAFTLLLVRRNGIQVPMQTLAIVLLLASTLAFCAILFWHGSLSIRAVGVLLTLASIGYIIVMKRKRRTV